MEREPVVKLKERVQLKILRIKMKLKKKIWKRLVKNRKVLYDRYIFFYL